MHTHPVLPQALWERTPSEVQAYIEALEARQASMRALEARVAMLEAMVHALQEQLHQTSRNSSRPPSSDQPSSYRPRRPPGKRRRGGQPGHPGSTRTLLSVDEVDEIVALKPEQCQHCDAPLCGEDPTPWRHQVVEIPPLQPVVTEYQCSHSAPCKLQSQRIFSDGISASKRP